MTVNIGDKVYQTMRESYSIKEYVVDASVLESVNWHLNVEGSPIHDNRKDAEDELSRYISDEIKRCEQICVEIDAHLEFLKVKKSELLYNE